MSWHCKCELAKSFQDGPLLIRAHHHKTAVTGPARLIVMGHDQQRLEEYVNHLRKQVDPMNHVENLFVYPGEQPITNLTNRLQPLARHYGHMVPTATTIRKAAATKGAKELSYGEMATLSKQMSHSTETSQRYYQALSSDKQALEAYHTIQRMQHDHTTKKRQAFSDEEEKLIKDYYSGSIKRGKTPALHVCKDFAKYEHTTRSAKQVQDKVRTIIESVQDD